MFWPPSWFFSIKCLIRSGLRVTVRAVFVPSQVPPSKSRQIWFFLTGELLFQRPWTPGCRWKVLACQREASSVGTKRLKASILFVLSLENENKSKARARPTNRPRDTEAQQLTSQQPPHSPLSDVLSSLQESRMIILLQRVFRLGDEGCRPLNALLAVCNLLSQLAKPHHLEQKHGERYMSVLL